MLKTILLFTFFLFSGTLFAQKITADSIVSQPVHADSTVVKKKPVHSPRTAAIMSAVLPGLGQVYNKKYWKVPLVFAGIGISLYFADLNNREYHKFLNAYRAEVDKDSTTINPYAPTVNLVAAKDDTRKNRDLSFIFAGIFYILNIIDATVDAHFYSFDVSDDLSLQISPFSPAPLHGSLSPGLKINFRF